MRVKLSVALRDFIVLALQKRHYSFCAFKNEGIPEVDTCSNLGVDLNKFQFGIVLKRFNDYLKNINLLMQETDKKTIRTQSGLYDISMKKVINQLSGASIDYRVLKKHKDNSNEDPEKFIRAKELIDEVGAFYMNVGHFFRELLSMLPDLASSEIEETKFALNCR